MNIKKRGFSLIELLVVIVIMGILATIAVGTFQSFFAKARDAKRSAIASGLSRVILAEYAGDWDASTRFIDCTETKLGDFIANNGIVPVTDNSIGYAVVVNNGGDTTAAHNNQYAVITFSEETESAIAVGYPTSFLDEIEALTFAASHFGTTMDAGSFAAVINTGITGRTHSYIYIVPDGSGGYSLSS